MACRAPITLVDETAPARAESDQEPESASARGRKRLTKDSLRSNLARRKYSKWQQDRYARLPRDRLGSRASSASGSRSSSLDATASITRDRSRTRTDSDIEPTETESAAPFSLVTTTTTQSPHAEIDILYENQRGWFFFGIPLFSDRSLLNFDPSAWMTSTGEPSPVNITNAQVPDPSWEWSWKTWYVDMSYDVDEEGWQYSFSFASRFSWHGTHPWFHSFVRRRRWLRQRMKKGHRGRHRRDPLLLAPSRTNDYFTVHAPSVRSYQRSVGANGTRSSFAGESRYWYDENDDSVVAAEDITNFAMLSKALKAATLDREKLDAVREFVHRADQELPYLEQKIPDIMATFLFQTSRCQLLERLRGWIDEVPADLTTKEKERRRESLQKALGAAKSYLNHAEYWTDATDISGTV